MTDTPCKECCFAIYEDITQVGCAKDRLEKYKLAGSTIIEAYDEDKEFYVIKNRICQFFRTDKWLDRLTGKTEEEINKILKFETMTKIHLIILLKKNNTIDDLKTTLSSVPFEFLNVPPAQVTIVKPLGMLINPHEIKELFSGIPVKWRMENLLVEKTESQIIHSVQKTIKTHHYCVCHAGYILPEGYFKTIDKAISDNLLQFGMIEVNEGELDGMIIPLHVHEYWYFHGNIEKTIPENVKEYQCQNPNEKIVFQLNQIKNLILQSA